jgi:hypothetical protein
MAPPAKTQRWASAIALTHTERRMDSGHIINLRMSKKNKPEIDLAQRFHGSDTLGP